MIDLDPERLRHAVGGDVVMGRSDAPRGEDVGVAFAQRVQRLDNNVLVVGHDAHFLQVDADIGQILGDEADVLVLGAPGQDFVADHKDSGGHDVSHLKTLLANRNTSASRNLGAPNALKPQAFAASLSSRPPVFQADRHLVAPIARWQCISRWPKPCYHHFDRRIDVPAGGVDLTFATQRAASPGRRMSNPKLRQKLIIASGPSILTFARMPAETGCEC